MNNEGHFIWGIKFLLGCTSASFRETFLTPPSTLHACSIRGVRLVPLKLRRPLCMGNTVLALHLQCLASIVSLDATGQQWRAVLLREKCLFIYSRPPFEVVPWNSKRRTLRAWPTYLLKLDAIGRQCRAFYLSKILSRLYLGLSIIRIIPYALQIMYASFWYFKNEGCIFGGSSIPSGLYIVFHSKDFPQDPCPALNVHYSQT